MLTIVIPEQKLFNNDTNRFIHVKETKIQLEHSLMSIQKWEAKYHKPFIETKDKSKSEMRYYVQCMTITQNVDPMVYNAIPESVMLDIVKYIDDPMTAAVFKNNKQVGAAKKGEFVSAETIYYWMITLGIPVEFRKWHLNQLLALIKFVNIKNAPSKKMSAREAAQQREILNAKRRAKLNSKG